jgi:hypothetical protein
MVLAVVLSFVMACGTVRGDDQPVINNIDDFVTVYITPLTKPSLVFKEEPAGKAPTKDDSDVKDFFKAYMGFRATPDFAKGAEDDATRRQANLKTMQFLALRNEWLARCLIHIIMDQAKYYCHQFSPYSDKLPLSTESQRLATRGSLAAPGGDGGATAASKSDPNAPLNNALLIQNADVAIVGQFVDTLKKLQKERHGKDLYDYLATDKYGDARVQHLILSILSDADLSPNPDDIAIFLSNYPKVAGKARFFLIQKVIPDPAQVTNDLGQIINVPAALARQLDDDTPYAPVIKPLALTTLKTITTLDGINNYNFIGIIADKAVNDPDPDIQSACNDTLSYFATLVAKDKKKAAQLAAQVVDLVRPIVNPGGKGSVLSANGQTTQLQVGFLAAVVPTLNLSSDSKLSNDITIFLLAAFSDKAYRKADAASRVEVANVLASMKTAANTAGAFETLQAALFAGTGAEQAAFLAALGAMTPKIKDDSNP